MLVYIDVIPYKKLIKQCSYTACPNKNLTIFARKI